MVQAQRDLATMALAMALLALEEDSVPPGVSHRSSVGGPLRDGRDSGRLCAARRSTAFQCLFRSLLIPSDLGTPPVTSACALRQGSGHRHHRHTSCLPPPHPIDLSGPDPHRADGGNWAQKNCYAGRLRRSPSHRTSSGVDGQGSSYMSNQHTTDPIALVNAARNGDVEAQDALASAYLPLLYNIVGRALNASSDVDDVVQDTMLRALDGLNGLRTPESFRSWLVAIAMNRVRAHWQDGMVAPGPLEEAGEVADPGADFVDLTMVRLQLSGQRLETARATRWLEPDDRSLLSLWWLECAGELTRTEVAEALELSSQSTAVRVQRMKAQLETARVVVRALDAQPPCQELRRTLTAWDGRPSALWRKRIARHARDCIRCAGMWSGLMPAEGLLAGLALVPVPAVLLALYQTQDGRMTPISAARPLDPAASHGAIAAASSRHRSSGKRNPGGRSTSRADARRLPPEPASSGRWRGAGRLYDRRRPVVHVPRARRKQSRRQHGTHLCATRR